MLQRLTAGCAAAFASAALFAAPHAQAAAAPAPPRDVSAESLVADLPSTDTPVAAFRRAAGNALAAFTPQASRDAASTPSLDAFSGPIKATGWQCAQFARLFTGIQIFGDAWTWWSQAAGKYARGTAPKAGSVLVFRPNGVMRLGHVAVVSQVLTDRIIQVTHANWSLIGGRRGQVEKDVTVVDVSPGGDWSQVKVWYDPKGDLGTTVYPTYGFVYKALDTLTRAAAAVSGQASASNASGTFASAR